MKFSPQKYYDAGENGAGGAAADTLPAPLFTEQELKDLGFENAEDAKKAFVESYQKSKETPLSDEQKAKNDEVEKANFLQFSTKNDLLKIEEYQQLESLKGKPAQELVYQKFAVEFKEDNSDLKPEELEQAIKDAFETEYKLNSKNEKEKARGTARLEKDAAEIRTPVESKVKTAEEKYRQDKEIRSTYPTFVKSVDELIIKNTPDKLAVYTVKSKDAEGKDVEENIEIELTKEDREAIAKEFNTPKTFSQFSTDKKEDFEKRLEKKIQGWIAVNKKQQIYEKIAEIYTGVGKAQGSEVGAGQPYAIVKKITDAASASGDKSARKEAVDSTRAKGF